MTQDAGNLPCRETCPEVNRYRILIEGARLMSRAMDLDAVLAEILRSSQHVMAAEACSLFLPDHKTGELIIHSALGDKAPMLNALRIPKGAGVAGSVYESKTPVNIQDPANDPRHYRKVDEKTGFVTRAMLTIPLLNGDSCVGVIQALNPVGRDFFDKSDEEIFEGFASLIASTLLRLDNQKRELNEAKVRQELELAREIQLSFLPPDLRILPTCQVRMAYFPARDVGGDFYFVHHLDDKRTLMGLGDVTGKGVPAALTMARATAEIKGLSHELKDNLGSWVTLLNSLLCEELRAGRFIGITFLLCDSSKSTMQVCTAGQYPPVWSDSNHWHQPTIISQLPLGILAGFPYKSEILDLAPGQIWLLFSDGITEARNPAGEEFNADRFLKRLPTGFNGSNTFRLAIDSWKDFVGDAEPHDDASLLMLDWRGAPPPAELDLTCATENFCNARRFADDWAKYAGFDDITVGQIVLAVDEATTNVFRYAYGGRPGPVHFTITIEIDEFVVQIRDQGTPADLSKIQGRSLDELRPGGLGVVLLHKVFHQVNYEPQTCGTILTLRKKIA